MHCARKKNTGNCQEVQDLCMKQNTGSRGICPNKSHPLKGYQRKAEVPEVIVIEDDDGDGEVENYDNESSLRRSHHQVSDGSGFADSESFDTYELSTSSSDEEDCVVIEPHEPVRASFVSHRFPKAGKRPRSSVDKNHRSQGRRSSRSDLSECEIVPDFDGKVKQDWEEAALRRRTEKLCRAESEESTSASMHANNDAQKSLKGHDGSTVQSQINTTWGEASRADCSFYAKKRKEEVALDQQGSNVNVCDLGTEASGEHTLLPQNKVMSARQGLNVNSKSRKLSGTGAGRKAKVDDTSSCFKAENCVKASTALSAADNVLTNREALKQTDEFRHAEEEEWAKRHLELQKQAENAQREKKKRKLEADRQIEMEARQKRRLEEIRQSQLKEELATGFKDRVRDRVQSELDCIAHTCRDMATLLKRLGVPVEGGSFATDQQVTAAYKKALLCFHPDRAAALAKGDPASQVEAEEKFKLVSRMKKVLPLVLRGFYR